jgi:hypothetical protein
MPAAAISDPSERTEVDLDVIAARWRLLPALFAVAVSGDLR